jgi:hypothetical protein
MSVVHTIMPNVALFVWFVAVLLGVIASVLMLLFRRPGTKVFEVGVSTLTILRDPRKYIRDPYARIVQILSIAALTLGGITVIGFIVWQFFA